MAFLYETSPLAAELAMKAQSAIQPALDVLQQPVSLLEAVGIAEQPQSPSPLRRARQPERPRVLIAGKRNEPVDRVRDVPDPRAWSGRVEVYDRYRLSIHQHHIVGGRIGRASCRERV